MDEAFFIEHLSVRRYASGPVHSSPFGSESMDYESDGSDDVNIEIDDSSDSSRKLQQGRFIVSDFSSNEYMKFE